MVLSPLGGRSRAPRDSGMHLAAQGEELSARRSRLEMIFPDSNSEHMFGVNAMDLSLLPPAARAGYDQGRALPSSSPSLALTPARWRTPCGTACSGSLQGRQVAAAVLDHHFDHHCTLFGLVVHRSASFR